MSKTLKMIFCVPVAMSLMTASTANAAVVLDTFTRPDDTAVGSTEVGAYNYIERGNSATATIPTGTADILGEKLRITGRAGSLAGDTGGVFVSGFESADITVSASVGFAHSIANPVNTGPTADIQELANSYLLLLRSRPTATFGTSAADRGLIGIEVGPNGDLLVREVRGESGTLSTGITNTAGAGNPFTNGNVNRRRLNPGQMPATFGGLPLDTNQNGFIDGNESFEVSAVLVGTSLSLYINTVQVGQYALQETAGLNGNGIGLHKNNISSAFETKSDIYIDNFAIPEPGSLGVAGAGAVLAVSRRRRVLKAS